MMTLAAENFEGSGTKAYTDDIDSSKEVKEEIGLELEHEQSLRPLADISCEREEDKEVKADSKKEGLHGSASNSSNNRKLDLVGSGSADLGLHNKGKSLGPDFRFADPVPLVREEDLLLYDNPTDELILSIPIPTMKPEFQFSAIRRIANSHYKGLPKSHQVERLNVNWCKAISTGNPEVMIKVGTIYRMIQVDLVSILGGIGSGGSGSNQGVSGSRAGSGWTQQHICEAIYLLNTYRGAGDCERVFIDLLARFHGQWGLSFKMFRQKFREICVEIGYSKGPWDVNNDRAYSQYTVLRSARKPVRLEISKERREFLRLLRTRSGVCSLLSPTLKERAQRLKAAIENIPQIKHISQRISLADCCDIILAKHSIIECADALTTFFKLKAETYFDSTERYRSLRPQLLKACSDALFQEKSQTKIKPKETDSDELSESH
ncbi:signal peptide-containing protein [Cryptosporidium felis]|nr:signal peptide-containing protein [Cryptosporidium felis]